MSFGIRLGVDAGVVAKVAEAELATRYLLVKAGSGEGQVDLCGASDSPLGLAGNAAGISGSVSVSLLGVATGHLFATASEAISAGVDVYTAGSGKIQNEPTAATGTYYQVGRALTAAEEDGDVIQLAPCLPRKLIVADAFTGVAATDLAALESVLQGAPDRIVILPGM